MSTRGKYKSKHYDRILEHLKKSPGRHFTVNEIHQELAGEETNIGTTTIYRQLDRMVEEGLINKYVVDINTPACYEYSNVVKLIKQEEAPCYHCRCESCGKLIHLHCEEIAEMRQHFEKHHHFKIDPFRTVFYGTCEECLHKKKM